MSRTPRPRLLAAAGLSVLLSVSACAATGDAADPAGPAPSAADQATEAPTSAAVVRSNVRAGATQVDLEQQVRVRVTHGTFEDLTVTTAMGDPVTGALNSARTLWTSEGRLRQDTRYRVLGEAVDADGVSTAYQARFATRALTLDEQTYPSFVSDGATVGVGMPAIVRFDIPVTDKASIERHLKVTSAPAQPGSWHWLSDTEVHFRPKTYWKPGTKVTVQADVGGVPAGNGIYGQLDRTVGFTVGDAMVSKVDMRSHQMKVYRNGDLLRTIPITTGEQPKFTTRTGTKVIMEKFESRRMSSETTGIPVDSADGYDIDDAKYAMRLTYSGEFIHAAPWSVPSQGSANVSHGCTGMSTADAQWLYQNSSIGDVVEYVGSDRPMTVENGYGDWNLPYADWQAGSSL